MKRRKQYPMDGPRTGIQALMMSPRRNAARLRQYFSEARHITRPDTRALATIR